MKVLVACECSGVVRDAFIKRGHYAYSCDLEQCLPSHPNHLVMDARTVVKLQWDLIIAHPPCTYLTVTGNKWFKPEYKDRFPNREKQREEAMDFFIMFAQLSHIPKVCIENPIGIMSTYYRKPDQIIQPYMFGHKEAKKTCLWLKGLEPLRPTKLVEPEYTTFKSGKRMASWYVKAASLPPKERERVRSRTFQGIADAMADQWGKV